MFRIVEAEIRQYTVAAYQSLTLGLFASIHMLEFRVHLIIDIINSEYHVMKMQVVNNQVYHG
jgi:hypothetical protein